MDGAPAETEKKSVIVVDGAPRRGGYTSELTDLFCQGVLESGGEPVRVALSERDIRPCRGCWRCWEPGRAGRCVQRDDMGEILDLYLEAGALVLASPVYFFSLSAVSKTFVERLYPLLAPRRGAPEHRKRGPDRAVLIAVQGHRDAELMDSLVRTFELTSRALGLAPAGVLLRPESHMLDFSMTSSPVVDRSVRAAFLSAGRQLALDGRVSPETERAASRPLCRDDALFESHTEAYWEIAAESEVPYSDRERLRQAVADDLRLLVPDLASSMDAKAAAGLEAVVLIDPGAGPDKRWHLVVSGGRCTAARGDHPSPDLALEADDRTFREILSGRTDAKRAMSAGSLRWRGDDDLATRLWRLFPRGGRSR